MTDTKTEAKTDTKAETKAHLKAVENSDATETATAETLLTIAEVSAYTNRPRTWILKEENVKLLVEGGAVMSTQRGKGHGSKIPLTLVDSLGWKREAVAVRRRRSSASVITEGSEGLRAEIAALEAEADAVNAKAAGYRLVIREKKAALVKTEREAARAKNSVLAREEKVLAAAVAAVEKATARIEALKAEEAAKA